MRAVTLVALALAAAVMLTGCKHFQREKLKDPAVLRAPYPDEGGDRLWAVLPPRNEAGTTVPNALSVGDALVAAIEEVEGLRALAMNRTLAALREAEIEGVSSPAEAQRVAELLGVDGVVIGTITAFDPYDPPKIGLGLALYAPGQSQREGSLDPRELASQPRPREAPRSSYREPPSATYSTHLDARNHDVLQAVKAYARGRHDEKGALGWRRHTASMDLYTRFAAREVIAGLLEAERERLMPEPAAAEETAESEAGER